MVAAGFKVYFLDGYRSTPELSFAVRYTNSSCGIMVTASHNPPSDNAVKVYWAGGVQVLPPHDKGIIDRVMNVDHIRRVPFAEALAAGKIVYCQQEIDKAFIAAVVSQATPGPRNISIIYSPLHGVGASAVLPAFEADGFKKVQLFGPHSKPDGDFPNVPGHVSNPENPAVFDSIIAAAKNTGADLILATDPDCDRMGAAAALSKEATSDWRSFTGNQLAALLAEYVLAIAQESWRAIAKTLRLQNARHDRNGSANRRSVRRRKRMAICRSASNGSARKLTMQGRNDLFLAVRNRMAIWLAHTCATRTLRWLRCCWRSWPQSANRKEKRCTKSSTICFGSTVITPKANFPSPCQAPPACKTCRS